MGLICEARNRRLFGEGASLPRRRQEDCRRRAPGRCHARGLPRRLSFRRSPHFRAQALISDAKPTPAFRRRWLRPYFKPPVVEQIDKLQTSLETYKLDWLTVNTVDNQNAEVLRTNASVVELVKADRWNGILPQTLLDGTGVTPLLGLPRQDNAGEAK